MLLLLCVARKEKEEEGDGIAFFFFFVPWSLLFGELRSLLQCKLWSFRASSELAFLSCSKLRAPKSSGACRAPESSGACCNASSGASELLRSLHFFHVASSEPRRVPELAELQRAPELAATQALELQSFFGTCISFM